MGSKKMNGSVPSHVLETSIDTLPNYEPEQTILDDTVTKVTTEYDESYDTEDSFVTGLAFSFTSTGATSIGVSVRISNNIHYYEIIKYCTY
jgi:hypothetical protein